MLDGRAALIGAIRQELFSGIKTLTQFDTLKTRLMAFDNIALTLQDYEVAAQSFNTCRANGVQGSNTDFLICAVAINHRLPCLPLTETLRCIGSGLILGFIGGDSCNR